jgi:hypothetical protein
MVLPPLGFYLRVTKVTGSSQQRTKQVGLRAGGGAVPAVRSRVLWPAWNTTRAWTLTAFTHQRLVLNNADSMC